MDNKLKQAEEALFHFAKPEHRFSAADFAREAKISRPYANLILSKFIEDSRIVRHGIARATYYTLVYNKYHNFDNNGLREEEVLEKVVYADKRYMALPDHVRSIVDYGFLEMCNNAIEHSRGSRISIIFTVTDKVKFEIRDNGIGVFRNIKEKRGLSSELEAVQDLLKGKLTTSPTLHSGEGIFFTSKVADEFTLSSYEYVLSINNNIDDIGFGLNESVVGGTSVKFSIATNTTRHLSDVFNEFSTTAIDGEPSFDTTEITIRLYQNGGAFISRSQARRVMSGLEKFKKIIIDFDKVPMVGQAFVDEVFRVFPNGHEGIIIEHKNANEAVEFMVRRGINTVR